MGPNPPDCSESGPIEDGRFAAWFATLGFAWTLLVSSALLFAIQPMAARALLPVLGGSAAVWTTCALFFQGILLAAYAYAYGLATRLRPRRQVLIHLGLMLAPFGLLPIHWLDLDPPAVTASPAFWLLRVLSARIGLPVFVIAASAPLLLSWFSRIGHAHSRDPHFLYAASNLGSLAALVAYPILIEPLLPLSRQARLWSIGYGVLFVLFCCCALPVYRARGERTKPDSVVLESGIGIGIRRRLLEWVSLAFVPSSLMLGVTAYISTEIAAVPLLWVVPLALYLLSFVLVFARRPLLDHERLVRLLPLLVLMLAPAIAGGLVHKLWIPLHLAVFLVAALVCHGALARRRPAPDSLTIYYLAIACGGVAGGCFNALVAPAVFTRLTEYPLAIVLACVVPFQVEARGIRLSVRDGLIVGTLFALTLALTSNFVAISEGAWGAIGLMVVSGLISLLIYSHRARPARFALGLGAVWLACGIGGSVDGRTLLRERNFYGSLRVTQDDAAGVRRLFVGTTLHGQQSLDPARANEPQAYFSRSGPIGDVFETVNARAPSGRVAVVGLGVGTLACYALPDQRWDFYELDPAVAAVATNDRYFTYLKDCDAEEPPRIVLGDARLRLRAAPDHAFALIVIDAFSSDAVPVHLLTREAIRLYRSKLAGDGMIAVNLTNGYLDLAPVIAAGAAAEGLRCRIRYDTQLTKAETASGKQPSIWAVLARSEGDFGAIASDPRWQARRARVKAWTDDRADVISHLTLHPGRDQDGAGVSDIPQRGPTSRPSPR